MSDRSLRRRIPVNRRNKPPNVSPSTRRRFNPRSTPKVSPNPAKVVQRCNSEPALLTAGFSAGKIAGEDDRNILISPSDGLFLRRGFCADACSSSPELSFAQSPKKFEGYNKDAKVVVNITVEGSPGPIRVLVKLGSSVDETIKIVMNKYLAEGRTPRLDKDAISTFELHPSYFSLQCFDKSDMIGNIGSRSFYLRKSGSGKENARHTVSSDIVEVRSNNSQVYRHLILFQGFIAKQVNKILRRTSKLWKILGCLGDG